MNLFSKMSFCCGCLACADICPQQAIGIEKDQEGFIYPKINHNQCINCGLCESVCPFKVSENTGKFPQAYLAVQAKDPDFRKTSSSGGVFPILALSVLQQDGIIYGAGFNDSMQVVHQRITNVKQLNRITKTKYVQSKVQGIFNQVKQDLQSGKQVLFVGTPCQAEALHRFLNKKYSNLLLIDLVCYGVSSPGVWKNYKQLLEEKYHGSLTDFQFRDKRNQDNGHLVSYKIGNKEYLESFNDNFFTTLYNSSCILRPSCYECPFTTTKRNTHITLGDFWGIENVSSKMNDGLGTSLVLLRLEENSFWKTIQNQFHFIECNQNEALQPRLVSPTLKPKKRRLFFLLYSFFSLKEIFILYNLKKTISRKTK